MSGIRLSIDHLWILTMLALSWLFLSMAPLPANDLWWHMAAGRIMVAEGALLTTNRWAYTLPFDAPYVYQSWLSEIVMYALYHVGDTPLLFLSRMLSIVSAYGIVAWHAFRRSRHGMATGLALLFAMMAGWGNWTLRPQTYAFVLGALFTTVIGEYLAGRLRRQYLWILPGITVVWVNIHGSFVLAPILLTLACLGTLLDTVRSDVEKPTRRLIHDLGLTTGATVLATFVNPLGVGIYAYLVAMLSNEPLQRWFIEWQPPVISLNLLDTGFWFFSLTLALTLFLALGKRRPSGVDLFWYCGLAWLGFDGVRYVVWFALLLVPLIAERMALLLPERRPSPLPGAISMAIIALLTTLIGGTLPWFLPIRLLGPAAEANFATAGRYRLLLDSNTPVAAAEWLAQHDIPGRFWTDMSFSSYTIWRLPCKHVFADLRAELFPPPIWEEYFAIAQGGTESLSLIDRWNISHLLVDLQSQPALAQRLALTPGWCETFREERMAIYVRCASLQFNPCVGCERLQ